MNVCVAHRRDCVKGERKADWLRDDLQSRSRGRGGGDRKGVGTAGGKSETTVVKVKGRRYCEDGRWKNVMRIGR